MTNNNSGDQSTIEQGGTGILERGRPDGLGKASEDQPVLPSRQPIKTPGDVKRK
jgi:hypothetical protein